MEQSTLTLSLTPAGIEIKQHDNCIYILPTKLNSFFESYINRTHVWFINNKYIIYNDLSSQCTFPDLLIVNIHNNTVIKADTSLKGGALRVFSTSTSNCFFADGHIMGQFAGYECISFNGIQVEFDFTQYSYEGIKIVDDYFVFSYIMPDQMVFNVMRTKSIIAETDTNIIVCDTEGVSCTYEPEYLNSIEAIDKARRKIKVESYYRSKVNDNIFAEFIRNAYELGVVTNISKDACESVANKIANLKCDEIVDLQCYGYYSQVNFTSHYNWLLPYKFVDLESFKVRLVDNCLGYHYKKNGYVLKEDLPSGAIGLVFKITCTDSVYTYTIKLSLVDKPMGICYDNQLSKLEINVTEQYY